MIYLLLGIGFSFLMSLMMRLVSGHIKNPMAMYMSNYVVCILLSLFFIGKPDFTQSGMHVPFMIGGISGALYLISLAAYDSNLRINGLSMAATFNKLGIIVPTVMAMFLFHENAEVIQLVGFVIAVASIIWMYFDKEQMKNIASKGMLLYLLLAAGICDGMANIYNNVGIAELKNYFLLFNFLFACFFSLCTLLVQKKPFTVKDCMIGALVGIPNYMSSRMVLYALSGMSAIVVYPVYNVAVLLLLILSGVLFFKEEMNYRKAGAIALVCISLVLLNL